MHVEIRSTVSPESSISYVTQIPCLRHAAGSYVSSELSQTPLRSHTEHTNGTHHVHILQAGDVYGSKSDNMNKCPEKPTTTSYAMLDFESNIENLQRKYLVIERHILQIQEILLRYLNFN